ncbi:hypothetical protein [Amycolatopsis sp. NPDC004378]
MTWFRVWAAVPLVGSDREAAKIVLRAVRQRLSDGDEGNAYVEEMRLTEHDWLQGRWRVWADRDEGAALWALRTLRGATAGVCRAGAAGRHHDRVETGQAFTLTVEPAEEETG